ncbi:quinone oxidoreductase [Egibacter rhizosphaerae]|uniref:Quinone oxidoreductase n=1 Tax=Egibacter rhizosphaerae TaxID=1670831 RepID=A0A411YJU6_9ACTN|nr:quinone oxidoreductase [Egibacter rhizosphaerae]QBI21479.1 quinone oxidoreductase [Egibacter rhizosphaerae]
MRAISINETGGPEVLRVADVDVAEPGPGEVRIRVAAAGVNFIDVYQRKGVYSLETPFTPGLEGAGTIEAVGPDVEGLAVGDTVAWGWGRTSYAEQAVLPAEGVVPVPDGVPPRIAAAVMLQGMTAQYLTTSTYPIEPGHVAVVHAGAGGVGLLLTQMAKRRGATVLSTVSSDEKAALSADAGADHTIRYDRVDVTEAVREHVPGGVDVVYDAVGRDTFDASLACLRPRGMMVLYGQSSGPPDPVDPKRLNAGGSLFLTRPSLAHHVADRDEMLWRAGEVFELIRSGELDVRIGEAHPLEDAETAHRNLEGRRTTGKVLLEP